MNVYTMRKFYPFTDKVFIIVITFDICSSVNGRNVVIMWEKLTLVSSS